MAFPWRELVLRCCWSSDCMFQPGGFNGSLGSGFGQRACVCPIWPQLKHLILVKSCPCRKGGRYPCPEANGVRGDPGGWFARWAIGRISYPILLVRANICDNYGVIAGSETPCPVHCERSIMANISSRVLILLHCKGLFRRSMYIDGRAKAGKIRTHLDQCLEFPVLLGTNHHPQVLLELWIRLSAHKLLTD